MLVWLSIIHFARTSPINLRLLKPVHNPRAPSSLIPGVVVHSVLALHHVEVEYKLEMSLVWIATAILQTQLHVQLHHALPPLLFVIHKHVQVPPTTIIPIQHGLLVVPLVVVAYKPAVTPVLKQSVVQLSPTLFVPVFLCSP